MQQIQEMDQLANTSNSPMMNKLMGTHQGHRSGMVNDQTTMPGVTMGGSAQAAMAMTNYHNLLARQNSMASNPNSIQQEASSSFNNSNQGQSSLINAQMSSLPVGGFPNAHLVRSFNNNNGVPQQQHLQASQSNQVLQQQLMQQMLQKMSQNRVATQLQQQQQQTFSGQNENSINAAGRNKVEFQSNATSAPVRTRPSISASARSQSPTSSISNSQKSAPRKSTSNAGGVDSTPKPLDIPQNTATMAEEDFPDIASELIGSGFFSQDFDSSMNFCWDS